MTWRICLQIFLQVSLEHSKPHLMVLFKMESDMLCTIVLVEYVAKPDAVKLWVRFEAECRSDSDL
jgi:hypothetical protein